MYEARQDRTTNVCTADAQPGQTKPLTSDDAVSGHPAWAPDRSRIIFVSNRDTKPKRNIFIERQLLGLAGLGVGRPTLVMLP